jgi:N-acetylglucosamine kinase-like BadF-type ATPase
VSVTEGRARFLAAMSETMRGTGHADATFAAACLGFSGGPADKEALTREIVRAETYSITHDALIALAGATAGEPGVICIAGTGSMAFGRNADGRSARAGGWGYVFGDEGGGFDLVRHALRAALREEEGWGAKTILRERLLETTGAASVNDLLHLLYTPEWPRARIATLAKLVCDAADENDAAAREIVGRGAQALATVTTAVRKQLFADGAPARVSYVGGVFRSQRVLERFRMLMEFELGNTVHSPIHGPAAGALLEAYRIAGITAKLENVPEEK